MIGYGRVSTGRQEVSLDVQRAAVESEAARRGWDDLMWLEDKGISGATVNRASLRAALALLEAGQAEALVCTKVDRLSRTVADFADLLSTAQRQGWNLIVLDLGIDLATPMGRAMAQVAAVFAELERSMIGQRTREALAVKRSQGIRLGRPATTPSDVIARVLRERASGATLQAIADGLNADDVPTAQGGASWKPGTIAALLRRAAA
ncbi:hypothetical protein F8M49_17225 [Rhodococcus zopfii]|uniref:Resolvase/invertase-type recombinase catalytic domain-containing protein n=1 Tax=Rhodococcus zopfii TaxID=43772 RepID=A0ABU3WRJ4_9NOCA|nr:hypothetical protein [Rhodococcus zopfii]